MTECVRSQEGKIYNGVRIAFLLARKEPSLDIARGMHYAGIDGNLYEAGDTYYTAIIECRKRYYVAELKWSLFLGNLFYVVKSDRCGKITTPVKMVFRMQAPYITEEAFVECIKAFGEFKRRGKI